MVTPSTGIWIGSSGRHNRLRRLESVVVTVKVDFRSELGNQKLSFDRRGTWTLATRAPPIPSGEGFPCRLRPSVDLLAPGRSATARRNLSWEPKVPSLKTTNDPRHGRMTALLLPG